MGLESGGRLEARDSRPEGDANKRLVIEAAVRKASAVRHAGIDAAAADATGPGPAEPFAGVLPEVAGAQAETEHGASEQSPNPTGDDTLEKIRATIKENQARERNQPGPKGRRAAEEQRKAAIRFRIEDAIKQAFSGN